MGSPRHVSRSEADLYLAFENVTVAVTVAPFTAIFAGVPILL